MSQAVLLDAGPLGLVTNPRRSPQSAACAAWLQSLVTAGVRVMIPEIADYEVRRELLRARKTAGIERLDALASLLEYLPITTAAMRQAAAFWATARQQGQPTAGDKAIDGDMILAAKGMTPSVDTSKPAKHRQLKTGQRAVRQAGGVYCDPPSLRKSL